MAWNILDNITTTGNQQTDLVNTLAAPAVSFPDFWGVLILLPIFIILLTRTFFNQKDKEGRGNIWGSLAISSFVTALLGLLLNLVGLLGNSTFSWVVGFAAFFIVIFLLIKD